MAKTFQTIEDVLKDLTADQAKAAELLFENDLLPKGKRKSYTEIANEIGVTDRTLRNWRAMPAMLAYKALATKRFLTDNRARVMAALVRECENGNASMTKLFMQAEGMLVDKAEIEVKGKEVNEDAVLAQLDRIKSML